MIIGRNWLYRSLVDFVLLIPVACLCVVLYWFLQNTLFVSTEFRDPKTDKQEYMAGDVMSVTYTVYRHRDCNLEISRLVERVSDRREYLVQLVTQVIRRDDPVFPRPSGYRVQIPLELTTDDYDVFTRVRYYCNGLDYVIPRHLITVKVRVKIHAAV